MTRPTLRIAKDNGCALEFREYGNGDIAIVEVEPQHTELWNDEWDVTLSSEDVEQFIAWWRNV